MLRACAFFSPCFYFFAVSGHVLGASASLTRPRPRSSRFPTSACHKFSPSAPVAMKSVVVIVLVACCASSALSLADDENKAKHSATVVPAKEFHSPVSTTTTPNTTTTTPKTTTTTTPKTTTTTPKTTTTTPKTTTTTPKTTTTTPKTTTTTPKTTTTTPKTTTPKTTTPKTTTTTPKTTTSPPGPTPSTNLTVGNYTLMTDDRKAICLMAQMALQIRVARPKVNGTFVVQPKMTKAEGRCEGTKANLTLVFNEGIITFMFNKSAADNTVYVHSLSFSVSYSIIKGSKAMYSANNESVHLFAAKVGHSYSCKDESIYMGQGLYLDVNKDRMQAFNLTKSNEFGSPEQCPADQSNYLPSEPQKENGRLPVSVRNGKHPSQRYTKSSTSYTWNVSYFFDVLTL
uniref:Lysosome-associated membrane glycoprotein 2-like luminal domain-containing protein n=1 Tax=Scophthalmus maximus TaxID=52904 RepID=A0A8D2ZQU3_SCOMX